MNRNIEEALKRGRLKVQQDRQKIIRDWRKLEDEWRSALPYELREYMDIVSDDDIPYEANKLPIRQRDLLIKIPGFAPIKTFVVKEPGCNCRQLRMKLHGHSHTYVIPGVLDDESGVSWDWEVNFRSTDDLDMALAWAAEQHERFEEAQVNYESQNKPIEPYYTHLDEAVMNYEPLSEEAIKDILRSVVQELKAA